MIINIDAATYTGRIQIGKQGENLTLLNVNVYVLVSNWSQVVVLNSDYTLNKIYEKTSIKRYFSLLMKFPSLVTTIAKLMHLHVMLPIHTQSPSRSTKILVAVFITQVFILYQQTFRLAHRQVQLPTEDLLILPLQTVFPLRQAET